MSGGAVPVPGHLVLLVNGKEGTLRKVKAYLMGVGLGVAAREKNAAKEFDKLEKKSLVDSLGTSKMNVLAKPFYQSEKKKESLNCLFF